VIFVVCGFQRFVISVIYRGLMFAVFMAYGFSAVSGFMVLGFKGFMFLSVRRTPADRKAGLKRSRLVAVSPGVWGLATNKQNP